MGEHHRVQQPDSSRQPRRAQVRQRVQHVHHREHRAQRLHRHAEALEKPVRHQRVAQESAAESCQCANNPASLRTVRRVRSDTGAACSPRAARLPPAPSSTHTAPRRQVRHARTRRTPRGTRRPIAMPSRAWNIAGAPAASAPTRRWRRARRCTRRAPRSATSVRRQPGNHRLLQRERGAAVGADGVEHPDQRQRQQDRGARGQRQRDAAQRTEQRKNNQRAPPAQLVAAAN